MVVVTVVVVGVMLLLLLQCMMVLNLASYKGFGCNIVDEFVIRKCLIGIVVTVIGTECCCGCLYIITVVGDTTVGVLWLILQRIVIMTIFILGQ